MMAQTPCARRDLGRDVPTIDAEPTLWDAILAEINLVAGLLDSVIAQTRVRVAGEVPDGAIRIVSLHDPDAPSLPEPEMQHSVLDSPSTTGRRGTFT